MGPCEVPSLPEADNEYYDPDYVDDDSIDDIITAESLFVEYHPEDFEWRYAESGECNASCGNGSWLF